MKFQTTRKTWFLAGFGIVLACIVLGLGFEIKILDLSISIIALMGILFAISVFLLILSIRSIKSKKRLIKWLARIYVGLFTFNVLLISASIAFLYDKTIYFHTIHDFYFGSNENFSQRKQKLQGYLDRQFALIDKHEMPNAERYKAEVLTSLGYTYLSAPSEDRINHLKLAQWYFKKAKNRYLKISGSYPQRYIETSLAEIEHELRFNSTRIIKPKNHNIWWADFSGPKEE